MAWIGQGWDKAKSAVRRVYCWGSVDASVRFNFQFLTTMYRTLSSLANARRIWALAIVWLLLPGRGPALASDSAVDFSRDILPLLSDHCFQCHGPDQANRKAGLRLDQQSGAFAESKSGSTAIVPGDSQQSAVFQRITNSDPEHRMPPVDFGKPLSRAQTQLIGQWIDEGAPWSGHWAFQSPQVPPLPSVLEGWLTENEIDRFVHDRLRKEGLAPEPPATKEALIRRVTLDLTGLPPTIGELDDFLADDSPHAYQRVVNRLLDSARHGEHMARIWLDAARYADTHGLHLDNERSIWPYRNWVIAAINGNMPFDQFTIEQLAGDLLPEPTLDQRVATGFNRCNVTTSEGGSIDDEYYVRYAVDRVETTSTVWMGLTAGCAVCHDHKFDPLTQKEFYQLFSYFFSLTENAMDGNALLPPPTVKAPSAQQASLRQSLTNDLETANHEIESIVTEVDYVDPLAGSQLGPIQEAEKVWFDDELPAGAKPAGDGVPPWRLGSAPKHPVYSGQESSVRSADRLSQHLFTEATDRLAIGAQDRLFAHVYLEPDDLPKTIQLQFHTDSWEHRAYWGLDRGHAAGRDNETNHHMGDLPAAGQWVRLEVPVALVGLKEGDELDGWAFTQFKGTVYWDRAGVVSVTPLAVDQLESLTIWDQFRQKVKHPALPEDIQKIVDTSSDSRSEEQTAQLSDYYIRNVHPPTRDRLMEPTQRRDDLQKQLADLNAAIPSTLVMEEREEPRQAHILERGEYTLKREEVDSRVPEWIRPPLAEMPANRLGLARWLMSPDHPLTARVTVNRYWQQFFGIGLVKTAEDFGIQGERPSHRELLDWLAIDFIESNWNVKRLQKSLVMSATYRQSSRVDPDKLAVDPDNRLLARGTRFRLDAEIIRDQALAVGGLLVDTIGGKSVKPYQPEGLWKPVGFEGSNTSEFKQDSGDSLYRRSMYTFWKRTVPPPSMSTFDAPDRETCQVRRARTNTPLQALVLMNDVQFLEAARKFAERVLTEGGTERDQRFQFAFRSVLARQPNPTELRSLTNLLEEYQRDFAADPSAAEKLLTTGESNRNDSLDVQELGAWTMITHLILNLSETVTKG